MRFWRSSAVVALILEEAASGRMRDLRRKDQDMLVWWGTLLGVHNLSPADALQLAAAVLSRPSESGPLDFVCLDRRLAAAAGKEGMVVLSEEIK